MFDVYGVAVDRKTGELSLVLDSSHEALKDAEEALTVILENIHPVDWNHIQNFDIFPCIKNEDTGYHFE
jgi:hypothetical protein